MRTQNYTVASVLIGVHGGRAEYSAVCERRRVHEGELESLDGCGRAECGHHSSKENRPRQRHEVWQRSRFTLIKRKLLIMNVKFTNIYAPE